MSNLNRDVILDLLPVYLAGDASEATQQLVKQHLANDPKLAQIIATLDNEAPPSSPSLPTDIETMALEKTKTALKQQQLFLGVAIFFTLFVFSFRFDSDGVYWLWQTQPLIAIVCGVIGAAAWLGFANNKQQLKID